MASCACGEAVAASPEGGVGPRAGEGAAACHIHDGQRGDFQAALGTGGTAVEEGPEPARLRAPLREDGRILRREPCRARLTSDRDAPWGEARPGKATPERPRHRALTRVAGATQGAKVDAASPGQDGHKQRVKALRRGFTDRWHLL